MGHAEALIGRDPKAGAVRAARGHVIANGDKFIAVDVWSVGAIGKNCCYAAHRTRRGDGPLNRLKGNRRLPAKHAKYAKKDKASMPLFFFPFACLACLAGDSFPSCLPFVFSG